MAKVHSLRIIFALALIAALKSASAASGFSPTVPALPQEVGFSFPRRELAAIGPCPPTPQRDSKETIPPPDYLTFMPPPTDGSYCDPAFGSFVRRLTESGKGFATNSEIAYFNLDDSLFVAVDDNVTYLFSGQDGQKIGELGRGSVRPWWIRWPRANYYTSANEKVTFDPTRHFYKYEGNEIRLYNLDTLEYIVLRRFSEYTQIGPAGGEGDISQDGRYWVLNGIRPNGELTLFAYDLLDDIKGREVPFVVGDVGGKGTGVDYATISPSGQYVVVAWDAGPEDPFVDDQGFAHYGVEVFARDTWEYHRRVHPIRIHFDLGYDASGHEVLFATAGNSAADLASFNIPDLALGDVVMVRLDDGVGTKLLDVPRWAHQTTGVAAGRWDYVFFAFEARSEDPAQHWSPYWGEIVAIPTDGSGEAIRLLHHRSRKVGDMTHKAYQPDFFPSNRGDKIVFQSTYGLPGTDLYLLDVQLPLRSSPFEDVPPQHPYYPSIEAIYQAGYVKGCSLQPPLYCPDRAMNRAESAVFTVRGVHGADFTPPQPTAPPFADVSLEAWYPEWVAQLKQDGYTAGCSREPPLYCAEQTHTRAEGAVFFLRMLYGPDYQPPPAKGYFVDVDPDAWYADWVDAAWEAGIAQACTSEPNLLYCPEEPLTRAVAAYMMARAKGLIQTDPQP